MTSIAAESILIFAANPASQAQLRLDKEVREIQNGLRHSRKKIDVKQQWATRPEDLRRALLDHNPHYVHFCGHGGGQSGIILEGKYVSGDALARLFGLFSRSIKCVVLNACYSVLQARAIADHVDYVVGMSSDIGDSAAIEFAVAFYDALGAGESIEFAFALGCNAIQLSGIPEHLTPVLLARPATSPEENNDSRARPQASNYDWDGAPATSALFGREAVAELLRSWILDDFCRVVLITGLGGIGKTDFVTCLARGGNRAANTSHILAEGIHGHFECVIWRSLLNAPLPEDLFADLLAFLSGYRHVVNSSPTHQVAEIVSYLKERRCLMILDNAEAILEPGDPSMRYRDGYQPYGFLIENVAKISHRSCLLITSREKLHEVAESEGIRRPVRSLALSGIGQEECQLLFSQIGTFYASNEEWERVADIYQGNPLALELAARHIDQVFSGSLTAFLAEGRSVFYDLQELLDWHLNRLSREESEIIYWLAIEREPVSIAILYEDLLSPSSREHLPSTLQTLQRRVPLERAASQRFALQPVLIEHVTARLVEQVGSEFSLGFPGTMSLVAERLAESMRKEIETGKLSLLNLFALVKATAKEHVRESQKRLILNPVIERLSRFRDNKGLGAHLLNLLHIWRQERPGAPGYVAGNIFNLLSHMGHDLRGQDFSRLRFWQAYFQDTELHGANFSLSEFRQSVFAHSFGNIFSLCYSPDGSLIAVGDDNGEVRLFHAASGQPCLRCVGHSDVVGALAFSPDGKSMASASYDHSIRLWRTDDGRCVNIFLHQSWVYSIAFSPSGKMLASAGEDGTVRLWDLSTGTCIKVVDDGIENFFAAVAFSPDGQLLAYGGNAKRISIVSSADLSLQFELTVHSGGVRALAFSPDGSTLVSGTEDGLICAWSITTGRFLKTLIGHSGPVRSLSFSTFDDLLASSSDDHTVRLWSLSKSECVGSVQASASRVWSVSFSPTGRTFSTGSEDSTLRVWDVDNLSCLMTLRGHCNKFWSLEFSSDSALLVSGSEDRSVRVWDTRLGQAVMELRGHESRVWAVSCSADQRWIASASDDLAVIIWDMQSGISRHVMRGHENWIRAVAFGSDSSLLASAGEDDRICIWDVASGALVRTFSGEMVRVFSVAFCGQWIVAGGADHRIRIFSLVDGRCIGDLVGHSGAISSVRSGAKGSLVSCSVDGTVKIWDLSRLDCLCTLDVGSKVWYALPLDEERLVVSASDDGMLRLWSVDSGACESRVKAHEGSVWSLAASRDERAIASAGSDGAIRMWSLTNSTLSSFAMTLRAPRPYEGMNITGATGLNSMQKESLVALGAIEMPSA